MVYYVNYDQLRLRQRFLSELADAAEKLDREWFGAAPFGAYAQERILHLAIESVTDIGSLLIDGFMMRDAGSYEDIIEILRGEEVMDERVAAFLTDLIRLRRPLVQDYVHFDRASRHPLLAGLPDTLRSFSVQVDQFLERQPLK